MQDAPDSAHIIKRVQDIKLLHRDHFDRLRLLDEYSRQRQQNWFPASEVRVPSVVRSNIRAAEKTAIAFLTGNEPQFRGSRSAGDASLPNADTDVEKIARAVWALLDRQSEFNLLQETVKQAIRRGEIIFQYGWLDEASRGYDSQTGRAKRFPIFVKSIDRLRVYYEISPFGEPLEVYHEYRTTVSQVVAEFPDWEQGKEMDPINQVRVIDAWVGPWHAVLVDGAFIKEPTEHKYGDNPPFVIERCAAEDVAEEAGYEYVTPVFAGVPLCLDMLNPFEEACKMSSLTRMMVENAAIGSWLLEMTQASAALRSQHGEAGTKGASLRMGPGTITQLYPGEKVSQPPVAPLPPALQAHLGEAEGELAALGFAPGLLRGEVPGDPSGYSIEQVRQAAMARLQPYKAGADRSLSRLFERLFVLLSQEWAPEWEATGGIPASGMQEGKPFSLRITQEMVTPPPDHIAVEIIPMLPQNQIALWQGLNSRVQAGTMDPVDAMREMHTPDPEHSWGQALKHKYQWSNPEALAAAAHGVLDAERRAAGIPTPAPQGLVPTGNVVAAPPPGAQVVGPPVAPTPLPPQPQRPGPPPLERNAGAPLGVLGAPNLPIPTAPTRPNANLQV